MLITKDFAVLYSVADDIYIAFSGGLQRTQNPMEVVTTTDAAPAPIARHNAGNEDKFTGVPTGFMSGARLSLLYPYASGRIKLLQRADSNATWILYTATGTRTTLYNCFISKEPSLALGVAKTNVFGSMEFTALNATAGDYTGQLEDVAYGIALPDIDWLPAEQVFHGQPLVSWYANRTSGAAKAQNILYSDATNPADGDTVSIGSVTYTFKNAVGGTANQVKIGGTAAITLAKLKKAINLTGTAGDDYGTLTVAHPLIRGTTLTDTTLACEARVAGADGNAIVAGNTGAHYEWDGGTFYGGSDAYGDSNAVAYNVVGGDPGWKAIETADGVMINPTVELGKIGSGRFGVHGYTVDGVGANVVFQPVSLGIEAFRAAKNRTPGTSLVKGDVRIASGALTVTLTSGSFAGGQEEYSTKSLLISPVTIQGNATPAGGGILPLLKMVYAD